MTPHHQINLLISNVDNYVLSNMQQPHKRHILYKYKNYILL